MGRGPEGKTASAKLRRVPLLRPRDGEPKADMSALVRIERERRGTVDALEGLARLPPREDLSRLRNGVRAFRGAREKRERESRRL